MSLRRFISPHLIALNLRENRQNQFERQLERAENAVAIVFAAHFRREMFEVLKIIRRFSLDELVATQARVSGTSPIFLFARDSVRVELRFAQNNRLNEVLEARVTSTLTSLALDQASTVAVQMGTSFPGLPEEAERFINDRVPPLVGVVNETSLRLVSARVKEAIEQGVGRPILAERIRDIYQDFNTDRVQKIARTEAGMVMSVAERAIIDRLGDRANIRKTWLTARDEVVRASHRLRAQETDPEFGGQPLQLDVPYANGLLFPRDPAGSAREVIRCRCTQLYTKLGSGIAQDLPEPFTPEVFDVRSHVDQDRSLLVRGKFPDDVRDEQLINMKIIAREPLDPSSVNGVEKVTFEDGTFGAWKAKGGENLNRIRPTIEGGEFYEREIATHELADFVGWGDLVPRTKLRTLGSETPSDIGPGQPGINGIGAMMDWVEGGWTQRKANNDGGFDLYDVPDEQFKRAAIFDFIVGNTDRHNKNWMMIQTDDSPLGAQKTLKLIDNGLLFPEEIFFGTDSQNSRQDRDDQKDGIRSNILNAAGVNFRQETIDQDLKDAWTGLDVDELKFLLEDRGFSGATVDGVLQRIGFLQNDFFTYGEMLDFTNKNQAGWGRTP